jgi:aminoglycoside phosphotransferase family enzyme
VTWRWRIKQAGHRLSQVHGDFHPWNVLFQEGDAFVVLDRSRGAWGEPADDVSAMTINYVFFSVRQHGMLQGPWRHLHDLFWQRYLEQTDDMELLTVIPPFYAWRALVLAHPVWYPDLAPVVRKKLPHLAEAVLARDRLDPYHINDVLA